MRVPDDLQRTCKPENRRHREVSRLLPCVTRYGSYRSFKVHQWDPGSSGFYTIDMLARATTIPAHTIFIIPTQAVDEAGQFRYRFEDGYVSVVRFKYAGSSGVRLGPSWLSSRTGLSPPPL